MQKQPLRVWLYARTADARPGVLEEQLNSLYREAERRGYTVVNGGAEHRCAGDLDRPALFAMLAAVRGGRVDAVMLTRLSRFSYHRLALYLILCFLQDHGVGLITTECAVFGDRGKWRNTSAEGRLCVMLFLAISERKILAKA